MNDNSLRPVAEGLRKLFSRMLSPGATYSTTRSRATNPMPDCIVCVPRLTSPLFGSVLESLNQTLARLGYQTMIGTHHPLPDEEAVWLQTLASWKPAAVVLASRGHSTGTLKLLRDMAVPVAEIRDLTPKPIDLAIGFSHFDNGLEMARCMTAAGRSKIGSVGAFGNRNTSGQLRYQGFLRGLAETGATLAVEENQQDQPGFYAGCYGPETMLARNDDLDGISCHDDEMAIGGLAYLTKIGLRVPADIGVAGWGGMEAASILPRRLTTTAIPTTRLGKVAAEAVVSHLRGDPVPEVTIIQTRLVPGSPPFEMPCAVTPSRRHAVSAARRCQSI